MFRVDFPNVILGRSQPCDRFSREELGERHENPLSTWRLMRGSESQPLQTNSSFSPLKQTVKGGSSLIFGRNAEVFCQIIEKLWGFVVQLLEL